jgi:zinc transport system substrate-binding protein
MKYAWLMVLLLMAGCGRDDGETQAAVEEVDRPEIYAVNYPLAWAAGRLAGETAAVEFPAPADVDPAFWEPSAEVLSQYQQADLVLLNGAAYAKWLTRVSLPINRMVDTSREITEQLISVDSGPLHSHGPSGEHSHGELAFTVWLDLALFQQQLDVIESSLVQLLPDQAGAIRQRAQALKSQLTAMDQELLDIGELLAGAPLLYSHPVYQYLQRRYQLNGVALHWEPDQLPAEEDWAALDAQLKRHPATLMLWEYEPMEATRKQLAERGIQVVVFRPMGNRPDSGDFASQMMANISHLQAVISK